MILKSMILKYAMDSSFKWFKENLMKAYQMKCQFMILGKTPRQPVILNINTVISSGTLQGLTIDNRSTSTGHTDIN